MVDIAVLRVIWWLLLGILLIAFAVTDGYDFGAATLLPLVAKEERERNQVLNSLLPYWEGNQVWIILGAGAIFAAWPYVYAVAFSGAYFPMLLLLLTMGISRPVSFKYRSKSENPTWRRCWDYVTVIGGVVPPILFGALVGNALLGLPFSFDQTLRLTYSGQFVDLFNPFALWCGLTSLVMLTMHGGLYLAMKTDNPVRERAISWSRLASLTLIFLFAGGGVWIGLSVAGYQVVTGADPYGPSNPLHKEVVSQIGAWLMNYRSYPVLCLVPMVGFAGAIGAYLFAPKGDSRLAFVSSGLSIAGIIGTVGVSMFPFILPSSLNLSSSLLVWDASSTELTLLIMLFSVAIFLPLILIYTAWVFRMLRGKVIKE